MENLENLLQQKKLVIFDFDGTIAKLKVDWPSCRKEVRQYINENFLLNLPENLRVDEMENILSDKCGGNALAELLFIRKK